MWEFPKIIFFNELVLTNWSGSTVLHFGVVISAPVKFGFHAIGVSAISGAKIGCHFIVQVGLGPFVSESPQSFQTLKRGPLGDLLLISGCNGCQSDCGQFHLDLFFLLTGGGRLIIYLIGSGFTLKFKIFLLFIV